MGYDYFFINETKKQIVGSKVLYGDFEAKEELLAYLSFCVGDTIRIVGEEDALIEKEVYSIEEGEYKVIRLYDYDIPENRRDSEDLDRLREEVNGH